MPSLVFFENWADPIAETILAEHPSISVERLFYSAPEQENWQALGNAHGYQIGARTEIAGPWFGTRQLLQKCPHLLAISSLGAGYDVIDVDACTEMGVIVCNQGGTNREAVAEHALGMMIALSKNIAVTDRILRRPGHVERFAWQGNDVYGKVLGIVGIGSIGSRLAELCRSLLAMRVLAFDPHLDEAAIAARGAKKVTLEELLRSSDFVSVHCPRSAETLGMFRRPQFQAMKRSAFFINTARGGIHDEDDLADALASKEIAGAGVDVFVQEPPGHEHRLLAFDNVIATPHIAGVTMESRREMASAAAEQWIVIFRGQLPPRLVNPEAWPLYRQRFSRAFNWLPPELPAA